MRDLSNADKQELARRQKIIDKQSADIAGLAKEKEGLQEENNLLNESLIDLQEQVWRLYFFIAPQIVLTCPANAIHISRATWAVWAAVKKHRWNTVVSRYYNVW